MWYCAIKFETGLMPILGFTSYDTYSMFGEYQTGVVVNILKCVKCTRLKHSYSDWFFVFHRPN